MHLKSLHINGFKSFARKGELDFSTPITAIVGPNGSGKSNVAEAFRFVLGEQSVKSMRGKRGEDLIFNGSESVSRSNRASVRIALDNEERGGTRPFPVEFDEIAIERVVLRDGVNEYSINGSKTRLKDVQELLAAANIGSTGHHIISQGEADRILTASAKERREMVEDALGLKVFQYKKVESEKKLKKTLENIAKVESLRREVAPHLKFLERQVKKLEKSLALREELKAVYAEYLKREDTYIAHHHDRLQQEKIAPEATLEELAKALNDAKEKLEKDKKQDEKSKELVALEQKITDHRNHRQETTRTIGQLEGQIAYLKRRIAEQQKRSEKVTESAIPFSEFEKVATSIEKTVEKASPSEDVSVLQRALGDVLAPLKVLLKNARTMGLTIDTKGEEQELASLEREKEKADALLGEIEAGEQTLQESYTALKQAIESEGAESREAEREVFRIMNEQRETEQVLEKITRELSVLERDRMEFKRELQEAVSLMGQALSRYFDYEVIDTQGKVLTREQIVTETRGVQVERRRALEKMKIRLEELGQGTGEDILKEYKDVKERDEFLVREIADLEASVGKLEELIADLTKQLNEQFVVGIEKIDSEFQKFFTLMFGGGNAALKRVKLKVRKKKDADLEDIEGVPEPEEEEEELEEGIEVDVKLPNKRVQGLDMLSGGERALTSIALIFAMSQVNPPLFVILDETDAALDEANSRRYGDMITALSERSQLILITHNRETMSRAGVLYGVTMSGDGASTLLSIKLDEAVAVAK